MSSKKTEEKNQKEQKPTWLLRNVVPFLYFISLWKLFEKIPKSASVFPQAIYTNNSFLTVCTLMVSGKD